MMPVRLTALYLPVLLTVLSSLPPPAEAATNAARGGVGGVDNGTMVGGDGTGAARIDLFTVPLALVKQARDSLGVVLPDGTDVYPGQELVFVLYVDNPTDFPAPNIEFADPLDEAAFTYVPGSLEEATVPTGATDAAIWAAGWAPLTDAVGAPDDAASCVDTGGPAGPDRVTYGAASGQVNQGVDIPARSLRAIRFRVRVN